MPALGRAKLHLGQRLGSSATAGEGVQNLMCAAQATAALVALIGASAGLDVIDPVAALLIAATAARESSALWRGDADDCCAPVGFEGPAESCCEDDCVACESPSQTAPSGRFHLSARVDRSQL
jgi:hypothetical protein